MADLDNDNLKKKKGIISRIKSFLFPHKPSEKMEDENKKDDGKFEYYDYDDNKMYTMFLERSSEAPIKIAKVADYYELFVRMLKTEPKNLHADEHLWVLGINKNDYSVCLYIVVFGYPNFFSVDPTTLFRTALQHDSVKIIICQSRPDAKKLGVTPTDIELTNAVYHKAEILGLELVDHIVISNVSIDSEKPFYCSHLEQGVVYFVQNDMTYKSYNDIKPEIEKARNEFGADKFIEGEQIGIDKGKLEEKVEMAKSMLKDGTDINFIMKHTGLTIKEINDIKKDMGL